MSRSIHITMISLLALVFMGKSPAQPFAYLDADCHALKPTEVSGVPNEPIHRYRFKGTCNINQVYPSGPKVLKKVPAVAEAEWNAGTLELTETFQVLAEFGAPTGLFHVGTGAVKSTFKCNEDPIPVPDSVKWVKHQNIACGLVKHQNDSGFTPFSNPALKQSRPLLRGKLTVAAAIKLSQQAAAKARVPPPPPPGQPDGVTPAPLPWKGIVVQGGFEVEGENLARERKFQVAGGQVTVQPMQDFGAGWSGGAQLLWHGTAPGAALDLKLTVPKDGRYAVEMHLTRAPDYADLQIQVDGKPAGTTFVGYAPAVGPSGAVALGTFQLAAGERLVSLLITGKAAQSTGYLAGIDRIRLVPVVERAR